MSMGKTGARFWRFALWVALALSAHPAGAQETGDKPEPWQKERFRLSVGGYSSVQLFDHTDTGPGFRLDYTF